MKVIRKGIFETNSSSTHALVIPKTVKEDEYSTYDSLWHDYRFEREECRLIEYWDEKLAYLYLILKSAKDKKMIEKKDIEKFKKTIKELHIKISKKKNESYDFSPEDIFKIADKEGYVDHPEDLLNDNFIKKTINDVDFLERFIFNKESYITVGSDEYRGYNIKTIGFEYDYEEKWGHCMNEKGELPPKEWLDKKGCIKDEYWEQYITQYTIETGEFWEKLREYEKDNDVYLKGN